MRALDAWRPWRRALALIGLLVLLDQVAKQVALEGLRGEAPVDLPLGFELDYVTNTGIAFGLLGNGEAFVIAITAAVSLALLAWLASAPGHPGLWVAVALLVGGALGNLADRVRDGAVIDFVDPPRWPAFNLADVAITAGVVVLVLIHARSQPETDEPR